MRNIFTTILLSFALAACASTSTKAPLADREFAKVKETKAPKYPMIAAREGIEGSVTLQFDVTEQGNVENISVIEATPKRLFDRAAIESLSGWKYYPKVVNGVAVVSKARTVTLQFKLEK